VAKVDLLFGKYNTVLKNNFKKNTGAKFRLKIKYLQLLTLWIMNEKNSFFEKKK